MEYIKRRIIIKSLLIGYLIILPISCLCIMAVAILSAVLGAGYFLVSSQCGGTWDPPPSCPGIFWEKLFSQLVNLSMLPLTYIIYGLICSILVFLIITLIHYRKAIKGQH